MNKPIRKGLHLFHTTSYRNLRSILKTGKIAISPNGNNDTMLKEPSGFIFSHIVFDDIVNHIKHDRLHWVGQCLIELDTEILKQYKFIICQIGSFDDVKNKSEKELKKMKEVYVYRAGNLKRMPSLKNAKKKILKNISGEPYLGQYMHSHEVLFMKDIPISLCTRIIVYDKDLYKLIELCFKRYKISNIQLSLLPHEAMFNTNLFIKSINGK